MIRAEEFVNHFKTPCQLCGKYVARFDADSQMGPIEVCAPCAPPSARCKKCKGRGDNPNCDCEPPEAVKEPYVRTYPFDWDKNGTEKNPTADAAHKGLHEAAEYLIGLGSSEDRLAAARLIGIADGVFGLPDTYAWMDRPEHRAEYEKWLNRVQRFE